MRGEECFEQEAMMGWLSWLLLLCLALAGVSCNV